MDVELLQAIRTVIKEEIEPVKKELKNVKGYHTRYSI